MARNSATRIYVPLDAAFFDDDKVVEAGEAAGWLYLNMVCRVKQLDSDGVLTRPQISRLSVTGWQKRLARLVEVGLVRESDEGFAISAWLKWHEPSAVRSARARAAANARWGNPGEAS